VSRTVIFLGVATLILDGGQASEENRAMAIIEARGLARTFKSRKRTVEAVRGVDLTVGEGEIVGFLGPNGAGKTTTLRMLFLWLGSRVFVQENA
jgi:ABC-type glutathione transport system ATPase component